LLDYIGKHDAIVSSTGFLSRELFFLRKKRKEDNSKDFMCVGSMGHASGIAYGIARVKETRKVW